MAAKPLTTRLAPQPSAVPVSGAIAPGAIAPGAERHLTYADVCERLRALRGGRTLEKWGREWGVDFRELSAVMKDRRRPGKKLLSKMGLRQVAVYEYERSR